MNLAAACPMPKCLNSVSRGVPVCRWCWRLIPVPLKDALRHYGKTKGPTYDRILAQAGEAVLKRRSRSHVF